MNIKIMLSAFVISLVALSANATTTNLVSSNVWEQVASEYDLNLEENITGVWWHTAGG